MLATPKIAIAKAGEVIGNLLGRPATQRNKEEEEVHFDVEDDCSGRSSRNQDQFPNGIPSAAGNNVDDGGSRRASSFSSSDESSEDSRRRRRRRRRKKHSRRSRKKSRRSRRYSGITDVLDLEFTDDDSISPPPTSTRKTQASKFVEDIADSDIEDVDVILRKEDYGVMGTQEYQKNMALATESLETSFGVTGEGMVERIGGEQDGDQKGFWHIQRIISDMNHRVKEAEKRFASLLISWIFALWPGWVETPRILIAPSGSITQRQICGRNMRSSTSSKYDTGSMPSTGSSPRKTEQQVAG